MTPEIIAHRGASYLAPENTLSAFRKAMEIGADGVEMDVQQTSDKKLVIHHDFVIDWQHRYAWPDLRHDRGRAEGAGLWQLEGCELSEREDRYPAGGTGSVQEMEGTIVQLEMKATIDDDPDFVPRVIEEVRAANITDRLVVISFNHDLLRQAKQLMPELKVGVLVYGALETMALPTSTWKMLGLQNGLEEDDFPQLPPLSVENVDDENCSWALRWMGNQISMLQANFPGKSLVEVAQRLLEQRDPVKYVQTLDFKPDWVSCEYHTAYQQPSMVQKLHDLWHQGGILDGGRGTGRERPLAPAAGCHRHKPPGPRAGMDL